MAVKGAQGHVRYWALFLPGVFQVSIQQICYGHLCPFKGSFKGVFSEIHGMMSARLGLYCREYYWFRHSRRDFLGAHSMSPYLLELDQSGHLFCRCFLVVLQWVCADSKLVPHTGRYRVYLGDGFSWRGPQPMVKVTLEATSSSI